MKNKDKISNYLYQLNGEKHLILGNHDKVRSSDLAFLTQEGKWQSIQPYKEITIEKKHITLCHYAMRVWNHLHHGSWMLFGHSHGTLPEFSDQQSIDVGVDNHNYAPISFEEIKRIMRTRTYKPVDHHGNS